MSIDKKLLTAFALGEARGDDLERAQALVERDPEAKRFVEEVKAFSKSTAEGLAKEAIPQGKGIDSIRAEIQKRGSTQAAKAEKKQYWVEALLVCALLVAFVPQSRRAIMTYLQMGFQNSQGPVQTGQATMGGPFSGGGGQGRVVQEKNLEAGAHDKLFSALGELESRTFVAQLVGRCKVQLPALSEKDNAQIGEGSLGLTHHYAVDKAIGDWLQVTVATFSRKHFTWESQEEFGRGQDYTLVKRAMGGQPAVMYFVPQSSYEPVCGVQATIAGVNFDDENAGEAKEALQNLARKIAESVEFR